MTASPRTPMAPLHNAVRIDGNAVDPSVATQWPKDFGARQDGPRRGRFCHRQWSAVGGLLRGMTDPHGFACL